VQIIYIVSVRAQNIIVSELRPPKTGESGAAKPDGIAACACFSLLQKMFEELIEIKCPNFNGLSGRYARTRQNAGSLHRSANELFAFDCKCLVMFSRDKQKMSVTSRPLSAWMIRQQLEQHCANASATVVANLINGCITAAVFWGIIATPLIVVAFTVLAALVFWRVSIAREFASLQDQDRRALFRVAAKVNWNAAALGSFWGWTCGGLLMMSGPMQQMFVAIIGSGMISAGSITFRARRAAATLYVLCAVPGCLVGLLSHASFEAYAACGLLFSYAIVLVSNIRQTARVITLNFERQREIVKSGDTIRLLLNDFTEQGADWLVELDADGAILNPSNRFCDVMGLSPDVLEAKCFPMLFDPSPERNALAERIGDGAAFRGFILSLTLDHEPRWWSISARPTTDDGVAFRGVVTDITAQRQAEERVSYLAHYDGLTDLPNRFQFNERLYRALHRDGSVGLMYLDLDNFKTINDTLGHPVGDKLLMAVARRLEACIGKKDVVARLGGDEFAILIPRGRLAQMDVIAERIIATLCAPISLGDHDVVIGATIGMVRAPDQAADVETLFRNADLAMYAAKARGRNLALWFESSMDEAAQRRRQIEVDLRGAITKNEMRLHYQPMINAKSGLTSGYEALIRWEQPDRGYVMPNDFIPIAEETGLIIQIGEWVIRQALDDLRDWADDLSVSVNLSPAQMRSPTLLSTVMNALANTGVRPERLCLEITESVLMQDSEANISILHKIRALGVQIALDDFGTGYSSLNYLRSFPFSKIKIDRCFVSEIDTREDCRAIIRSVVSLANSLGMSTVAEGVERIEQLEELRREGCDEVQGFFYSAAVPAHELSDLRNPKTRPDLTLTLLENARQRVERAAQAQAQAELKPKRIGKA
jgi:diguanylate cyclase (GGDEF)-like protein/PAS domain S-box-containing protein